MKISVALCTYNGEKFIKEQLESIVRQTTIIDEIIICDDRSNDKTMQIIEEFQSKFPDKLYIYENKVNLGSNKNFEKAISICSGDYIFLSDQDDIWENDKVEKTVKCFEEDQLLEGVFSNANLIDANGTIFTNNTLWDSAFFLEEQLQKKIDLFCLIKSKKNMVTGATLCFKKEIKELILPIPLSNIIFHDQWIAIILSSRKKLGYITDKLISYRIHAGQQIGFKKHIRKNKFKQHLKFSNYVLGHATPKSHKDLKQLTKIYFRNYLKYQKVADNINENFHLNFNAIAKTNLELFIKHNDSLKKANPVLYFFNNIIDRIRGKRQLN